MDFHLIFLWTDFKHGEPLEAKIIPFQQTAVMIFKRVRMECPAMPESDADKLGDYFT